MTMFIFIAIALTCQMLRLLAKSRKMMSKKQRRHAITYSYKNKEEFMKDLDKELKEMVKKIYEDLGFEPKTTTVEEPSTITQTDKEDIVLTVWNRKILDPNGKELRTVGEVLSTIG